MQGKLGHSPSNTMPRLGDNSQCANVQPLSGNKPRYCQIVFCWCPLTSPHLSPSALPWPPRSQMTPPVASPAPRLSTPPPLSSTRPLPLSPPARQPARHAPPPMWLPGFSNFGRPTRLGQLFKYGCAHVQRWDAGPSENLRRPTSLLGTANCKKSAGGAGLGWAGLGLWELAGRVGAGGRGGLGGWGLSNKDRKKENCK